MITITIIIFRMNIRQLANRTMHCYSYLCIGEIAGLQLAPITSDDINIENSCDCRQACNQRSYQIKVDKGIRQELIPVPVQLL